MMNRVTVEVIGNYSIIKLKADNAFIVECEGAEVQDQGNWNLTLQEARHLARRCKAHDEGMQAQDLWGECASSFYPA